MARPRVAGLLTPAQSYQPELMCDLLDVTATKTTTVTRHKNKSECFPTLLSGPAPPSSLRLPQRPQCAQTDSATGCPQMAMHSAHGCLRDTAPERSAQSRGRRSRCRPLCGQEAGGAGTHSQSRDYLRARTPEQARFLSAKRAAQQQLDQCHRRQNCLGEKREILVEVVNSRKAASPCC